MIEAYEILKQGGPIIIPIALCSVIALTIFLERLWSLHPQRLLPTQFVALLKRALAERRFERAQSLCEANPSAFARVALAALAHQGRDRGIVKDAIEEAGHREIARMERFVGALGSIASVAPLLGLLGTVTGMIAVFKTVVSEVKGTGEVNPASLANGIWEALITTAAGLSVAIPAFLMFKYLMAKIDRDIIRLEEQTAALVDPISAPDQPARGLVIAEDDEVAPPGLTSTVTAITTIPGAARRDLASSSDATPH
jgi:biopolymer transport protein ExbB